MEKFKIEDIKVLLNKYFVNSDSPNKPDIKLEDSTTDKKLSGDIILAKKITEIFSEYRSTNYSGWIRVYRCLKNIKNFIYWKSKS
jgi:neutral trehalase